MDNVPNAEKSHKLGLLIITCDIHHTHSSLFQKISVEIIKDFFYLSQNGNYTLESLVHCFKVENYSNVFFKGIM